METVNQVLQPVLLIVLPVLAVAFVVWLRKAIQRQSVNLSQEQLMFLRGLVRVGVWAAEQAWQSGELTSERRLGYVLDFVQAEADRYGLRINVTELVKYVEAAVAEELNKNKYVLPSSQPTK